MGWKWFIVHMFSDSLPPKKKECFHWLLRQMPHCPKFCEPESVSSNLNTMCNMFIMESPFLDWQNLFSPYLSVAPSSIICPVITQWKCLLVRKPFHCIKEKATQLLKDMVGGTMQGVSCMLIIWYYSFLPCCSSLLRESVVWNRRRHKEKFQNGHG